MSEKLVVDTKVFPSRLQEAMADENCTTYELADVVSLTAATISRYSNGKIVPKITTLFAMAEHLDVNPLWLMGYDVGKYEKPATTKGDGLDPEIAELVKLYLGASPEMQAAALGMLEAAEKARVAQEAAAKDK